VIFFVFGLLLVLTAYGLDVWGNVLHYRWAKTIMSGESVLCPAAPLNRAEKVFLYRFGVSNPSYPFLGGMSMVTVLRWYIGNLGWCTIHPRAAAKEKVAKSARVRKAMKARAEIRRQEDQVLFCLGRVLSSQGGNLFVPDSFEHICSVVADATDCGEEFVRQLLNALADDVVNAEIELMMRDLAELDSGVPPQGSNQGIVGL